MTASQRPVLRDRRADDLAWEWHWTNELPDPEWKRWDAPYFHVADVRLTWAEFSTRIASTAPDRLMVELAGAPVGVVTRHERDPRGGGWWELGIVLYDPARFGQGIGTAALREWARRTFAETGAAVLTLVTWSGNARMIGAAHRSGFTECGRVPQARLWEGQRFDSVTLALLRPSD